MSWVSLIFTGSQGHSPNTMQFTQVKVKKNIDVLLYFHKDVDPSKLSHHSLKRPWGHWVGVPQTSCPYYSVSSLHGCGSGGYFMQTGSQITTPFAPKQNIFKVVVHETFHFFHFNIDSRIPSVCMCLHAHACVLIRVCYFICSSYGAEIKPRLLGMLSKHYFLSSLVLMLKCAPEPQRGTLNGCSISDLGL